MEVKEKKREIVEEEKAFTDELDVKKFIATVHSPIETSISSDYILAKLNTNQIEYLIEQGRNAEYVKFLIQQLKKHCKGKEEEKQVQRVADDTHQLFLTEAHLIVNLHKNQSDNHLINAILNQTHKEEQGIMEEPELKTKINKIIEPEETR